MAKDVESALLEIFQKHGNMTSEQVHDFIANEKNRFLKDLWTAYYSSKIGAVSPNTQNRPLMLGRERGFSAWTKGFS